MYGIPHRSGVRFSRLTEPVAWHLLRWPRRRSVKPIGRHPRRILGVGFAARCGTHVERSCCRNVDNRSLRHILRCSYSIGRILARNNSKRAATQGVSNLERLLAKWRNPKRKVVRPEPPPPRAPSIDPATRRLISPIVAAALCIKPRGSLTSTRAAKVDAPKSEWPDFAAMRRLAMQFRGILRSKNASKLATWLKGAQQSGLYAMQRFARTLRWDMDAVRNAISERWSNGQTERQINRLKTFKRAMYGRAGPDLLHARMLPL